MNKNILWITRSAMFTALLVVVQAVTAGFGNTLITGSLVNLVLIISVMLCGPATGLTVAVISPVCAKLVGIGPLWALIPFIIAGNAALVSVWNFLGRGPDSKRATVTALVAAAVAKFLVLYVGIVKVAVPVLLKIPEPRASVISGMFSVSQLFTASVGGVLAIIILPVLKKAIEKRQ